MNNMLAVMIERVDSVQEKIDNVSRAIKTLRQNKNILEIKKIEKNIVINDIIFWSMMVVL